MFLVKEKHINIEEYDIAIRLFEKENIYSLENILYCEEKLVEKSFAEGITDKYEEALKLFDIIAGNCVFPCHLHNVIDDLTE